MAEDVLLIIEVSDTTLDYDRNRKIPLYAQAGIPEVWIVNLQNGTVELHYQARDYSFAVVKVFRRGEILRSERVKELEVKIDDILG